VLLDEKKDFVPKHRASVETSPPTSRRWVWELIENAKDVSIDWKVRVRIDVDLDELDTHITFKHNGRAFTTENIRLVVARWGHGTGAAAGAGGAAGAFKEPRSGERGRCA
jgi:hypothetical protein